MQNNSLDIYILSLRLDNWLRFPKPRATIVSELRNGARMERGIFEARAAAIAKERAGPAYVRALDNIVVDTATSNTNLQPVDILRLFDVAINNLLCG